MKKHNIFVALAMIVLALFTACSPETNNVGPGTLKVLINPDSASRTIGSNIPLVTDNYRLEAVPGEGVAAENITVELAKTEKSKTLVLDPGNWTITVFAVNDKGIDIGSGSTAVAVAPGSLNECSVIVKEFEGKGTLSVRLSGMDPRWNMSAKLCTSLSDPNPVEYKLEKLGGVYYGSQSVEHGSYLLKIFQDGTILWTEAVDIVKDGQTNADVKLEANGNLTITQAPDMEFFSVTDNIGSNEIVNGQTYKFTSTVAASWFVDGVAQAGDPSVDFIFKPVDLKPGRHTISAVVDNGTFARVHTTDVIVAGEVVVDEITLIADGRPLPDTVTVNRVGYTINLTIADYDPATTYKVYYDDVESTEFNHVDGVYSILSLELNAGKHMFRVDGLKDGKTITGKTYNLEVIEGLRMTPFHPLMNEDRSVTISVEPTTSDVKIPAGGTYTWKIWDSYSSGEPIVGTTDIATFNWTPVQTRPDGQFSIQVDYVNGEYKATTTRCTHYFIPRFEVVKPADIKVGETCEFSIVDSLSVVDPNAYTFEWKLNGDVIEGVTGPTASIKVSTEGYNELEISYHATSDKYANKDTLKDSFNTDAGAVVPDPLAPRFEWNASNPLTHNSKVYINLTGMNSQNRYYLTVDGNERPFNDSYMFVKCSDLGYGKHVFVIGVEIDGVKHETLPMTMEVVEGVDVKYEARTADNRNTAVAVFSMKDDNPDKGKSFTYNWKFSTSPETYTTTVPEIEVPASFVENFEIGYDLDVMLEGKLLYHTAGSSVIDFYNNWDPVAVRVPAEGTVECDLDVTSPYIDSSKYVYTWMCDDGLTYTSDGVKANVSLSAKDAGRKLIGVDIKAANNGFTRVWYVFDVSVDEPIVAPTMNFKTFHDAWIASNGDIQMLPAEPHYYAMTAEEYQGFLTSAGNMASSFSLENGVFSFYTTDFGGPCIIHQSVEGWSGESIIVSPEEHIPDVYMNALTETFSMNAVWYDRIPVNGSGFDTGITAAYENMVSVDFDEDHIAKSQADMIVDWLKYHSPAEADRNGDGEIGYVLLIGDNGHRDAIARTAAVRNAFGITETNKEGSIAVCGKTMKVVELEAREMKGGQYGATWNPEVAETAMAEWLSVYGDKIDLVISNNDGMALGAMGTAGFPEGIHVFGVDGNREAVQAIVNGCMTGTVYGEPEVLAASSLMLLRNRMDGLTGNDAWKTGIVKPDKFGNALRANFRFDNQDRVLYVLPSKITKSNAAEYLNPADRDIGLNHAYTDIKKVMVTVYNNGDNFYMSTIVPAFKKYGLQLGMDLTMVQARGTDDQMLLDAMVNMRNYDGILLNPVKMNNAKRYVDQIVSEMIPQELTFQKWYEMVSGCLFGTSANRPGRVPNFTRITSDELAVFDQTMKKAMEGNSHGITPVRCLIDPETKDFSVEFDMWVNSRYVINQRTDGSWYGFIRYHQDNGVDIYSTLDLSGSSRTPEYSTYWSKLPAAIQKGPILVELERVWNPDGDPAPVRGIGVVLFGGTDAKAEVQRYADIIGAEPVYGEYQKRDGEFVYRIYDYANTVCIDVNDYVDPNPNPKYSYKTFDVAYENANLGKGKMPTYLFKDMSNTELRQFKRDVYDFYVNSGSTARIEKLEVCKDASGFKFAVNVSASDPEGNVMKMNEHFHQDSTGLWTETLTQKINQIEMGADIIYAKPEKSVFIDIPSTYDVSAYGYGRMPDGVAEMVAFIGLAKNDVKDILSGYMLDAKEPFDPNYEVGNMANDGYVLHISVSNNGTEKYGVSISYNGDGKSDPSMTSVLLNITDNIEPLVADDWLTTASYSIKAVDESGNAVETVGDVNMPVVINKLKRGESYDITVNALNASGAIIGSGFATVKGGVPSADIVISERKDNGKVSVVLDGFASDVAPTVKYGNSPVEMSPVSGAWKGVLEVPAGRNTLVVDVAGVNKTLDVRVVSGRTTDVIVAKDNGTAGIVVENTITKTPEIVISTLQEWDPATRTFKLGAVVPGHPEALFTWNLNGVKQPGNETLWEIPVRYSGYIYVNVYTKCGDLFVSNSYELHI